MYSQAPWRQELVSVGFVLLFLLVFGSVTGFSYWLTLIAGLAWVGWHLYNLRCLLRWLEIPDAKLPDDAPGAWGHVYYRLQSKAKKETERKKQIRRLLKEFSSSTQAMPDAAVVLNTHFEIQWVNEAATRLLGVKRSDTGQPIMDLLRQPDFHVWLTGGSGVSLDESFLFDSPLDEGRTLSLRAVPYGQQQYLLVARDITERQQLDQMRQDFIANASHELRTPLTVLQGSLEILTEKLKSNAEFEQPLTWMQRQSERMQRILEDLLTLARLEGQIVSREMSAKVETDELIHSLTEEAKLLSDKLGGHKWSVAIDSGLWIVGNRDHVRILISNLITNAVRYTPSGGKISVSWHHLPGGAYFKVQDTGPGIPGPLIPRLTERFYRVDAGRSRESGGTGLGLAIVKHVLERYNTYLEVRSTPGVGSTFSFSISPEFIVDSEATSESEVKGERGSLGFDKR